MRNQDIRVQAKESGVFLYEVAEKIGVSEPTLTRMLRKDLSADRKAAITVAITAISCEKKNSEKASC